MGKPKAPEAPDPQKTIAAQTQSNESTARLSNQLGMQNKNDPTGGTVRYVADPNSPSGYRAETAFGPNEQAKYDKSSALDLQALGLAGDTLTDVEGMGPLNLDAAGNPVTGVPLQDMERVGKAPTPDMVQGMNPLERVGNAAKGATVGPAGQMNTAAGASAQEKASMGMLPNFNDITGAGKGIQGSLDYKSLGMLPQASDQTRQRVEDAVYARQQMRLDPQFKEEEARVSSQITGSGIPLGSDAHKAKMQEYYDAKERAYSGARNDSIVMGGAEQSRLINDQLAIRGQGAREIENAGTFRNQAQGQGFGQGVTQTTGNNQTAGNALNAQLAVLGQRNQAGQQDFQNQFDVTEQGNRATQGNFDNSLRTAGFNNDVGTNDLANALASTGQRNQATGTEFQAGAQTVGANNQSRSNEYTQNMQGTQMNNAAAQQEIQNLFANANMSNAQRQQKIQEIMLKYNAPLARYSTLTTGAQPMSPNFANLNFSPTNVANTDVAGIQQQGYTNAMGQYNANAAQANFLPQMIGTLGGAALGNPALGAKALSYIPSGSYSDRRLKSDIVRVGTLPSGLPWYSYSLLGKPERGVMADEARVLFPDAVVRGPDGFDRVFYDRLH